jgi:hypothetical protein
MHWHQVGFTQTKRTLSCLLTFYHSFAWAEMRMVAANMFSRYDFEEVPGQNVDFRQYITMQFATGSWKVWLRRRT